MLRIILGYCFLVSSFAAYASSSVANYDVYANDSKIGSMQAKREQVQQGDKAIVKWEQTTAVHAKVFFSTYTLNSKETAMLSSEGTQSYDRDMKEDEVAKIIHGQLKDASLEIEVQEGKKQRSLSFPKNDYDATMVELAESRVAPNQSLSLKVVNFDTLKVQKETYQWVKEETMPVGKQKLACKVIAFKTPDASGQRWIAESPLGPILVKEESKDKDGHYRVVLTKYEENQ